MTLNYQGDSREVPISKWNGSQFNSRCEIFSLLDEKKSKVNKRKEKKKTN